MITADVCARFLASVLGVLVLDTVTWAAPSTTDRRPPRPMAAHPGNVFVVGEEAVVPVDNVAAGKARTWKVQDDRKREVAAGRCEAGAGKEARVRLGPLGVGWYRIEFQDASGKAAGATTAAVLAPLAVVTPQDSPVCADTASAWFARRYGTTVQREHQEVYASLAALAGVNCARDRLTWGELEPARGTWAADTAYDSSAAAFASQGLNVLQVFHGTPRWAVDLKLDAEKLGKRFPRDLRDSYQFCQAMARRFQGRVGAWEPWNEANLEAFGGHTATEMCSLQKAAYLGFKAGDPSVTVCWNALAGSGSPAHTKSILANEAWPYFETYNIHSYAPPATYLQQFSTAREAASGRPLWLSECGIQLPRETEPPWGDMTPEDDMQQARFVAKSYASSLYAGIRRHFFAIFGNYIEKQTQFGLLRHDHTPRPGYVALAAVGRLLAGARCLGRVVPDKDANTYVYAFSAAPDGIAKEVLVAWADTPAAWQGHKPARVEAVYDYLGRKLDAALPDTLQPEAIFVVLPGGEASSLGLAPPAPLAPSRGGTPSPVVLQLNEPSGSAELAAQAYLRKVGEASTLAVVVYNFADHPIQGTIRPEHVSPGWSLEPASWQLAVEPLGRRTIGLRLAAPAAGRELLEPGSVTLRGDFGPDGRPVLAFDNLVRIHELRPAKTAAILSAQQYDAWSDKIARGASMTHRPVTPNGMRFDMRFGRGDPWGYPRLTLTQGVMVGMNAKRDSRVSYVIRGLEWVQF